VILHPAVIALLTGSVLVDLMIVYAAYWGWRVIDGWDLQSGSEKQLALEKKTYLISTLMAWTCAFQVLSFFLLVYVADGLHRLFVGAMCAAGTLNVNEYGYPALVLKLLNCVLAGAWLILNYTDSRARDYPLIRKKYSLLLVIAPLIGAESYYQGVYFLNLKADVITSCCGSLFSAGEEGVAAGLAGLPVVPMGAAFFGTMAAVLSSGVLYLFKKKGFRRRRHPGLARFDSRADRLHLGLFLRPADPPLPFLHSPGRIPLRGLSDLCRRPGREHRMFRNVDAYALLLHTEPCKAPSAHPAQADRCRPGLLFHPDLYSNPADHLFGLHLDRILNPHVRLQQPPRCMITFTDLSILMNS